MKALPPLTALAALAALALAGCNDKAPTQGSAGGELLPRSTTDEMLPYDTVQSLPSLAAPDALEGESRPRGQASGKAEENEDVVTDAAPPAAE